MHGSFPKNHEPLNSWQSWQSTYEYCNICSMQLVTLIVTFYTETNCAYLGTKCMLPKETAIQRPESKYVRNYY